MIAVVIVLAGLLLAALAVITRLWLRNVQLESGATVHESDMQRSRAEGSTAKRLEKALAGIETYQQQIEGSYRAQLATGETHARVADARAKITLAACTAARDLLACVQTVHPSAVEEPRREPILPDEPPADASPPTRRARQPPESEVRPVSIEEPLDGAMNRRECATVVGGVSP